MFDCVHPFAERLGYQVRSNVFPQSLNGFPSAENSVGKSTVLNSQISRNKLKGFHYRNSNYLTLRKHFASALYQPLNIE